MKLIRPIVAAFAIWATATCAWAAISHLTGFIGPTQASRASLIVVADLLERAEAPSALGAPQRLATGQLRRTAHSVERINGAVERLIGEWIDRLGHAPAHRHHLRLAPIRPASAAGTPDERAHRRHHLRIASTPAPGTGGHRLTITVDARSEDVPLLEVGRVQEVGRVTVDIPRIRIREASNDLQAEATFDRTKLKERLEKLIDLLQELERLENDR